MKKLVLVAAALLIAAGACRAVIDPVAINISELVAKGKISMALAKVENDTLFNQALAMILNAIGQNKRTYNNVKIETVKARTAEFITKWAQQKRLGRSELTIRLSKNLPAEWKYQPVQSWWGSFTF
jgi:L-lactate utilization protein LutB